jgi:D-alanyl-lipoteichoic acid acyltransferase DltB (MBOAT superfamily)
MFFNSIDFAIFLPAVFFLYWFVAGKNLKIQNVFIVIASYVFYGWWDWRFLLLIVFSTLTDYLVGIYLSKTENKDKRKILLWISVIVNILFLGFFKYYNFFVENFVAAFSLFGIKFSPNHLNIILPVGISFYTFQTMSYSIDIYKKKLEPTRDFIAFAAFVSFFPQLVAGPIERAANLLPQFYVKRSFSYDDAVDGCKQMLWGFFKKIVVADNCAIYVNEVWKNYNLYDYPGSTLFLAAILFAIQIYCDFSGYSDIAIGTSKLLGFRLMRNFAYPYFSRDMAEFWRRWHISLTTWFRDYIYFPLGGSRNGILITARNTFIIFLVSGFWHGANWTFVAWGFINALYFMPLLLLKRNRINLEIVASYKVFPSIKELFFMCLTFLLAAFAFIFFRAESIGGALQYLGRIFSGSLLTIPKIENVGKMAIGSITLSIPILILGEWVNRREEYGFKIQSRHKIVRWLAYTAITMIILELAGLGQGFIYFQF